MPVQTRSRSRQDLMATTWAGAFSMQCLSLSVCWWHCCSRGSRLQEKTFSQRTILQASLSLDLVLSLEKCKIWIALNGVRRSPGFLANMIPGTPWFFPLCPKTSRRNSKHLCGKAEGCTNTSSEWAVVQMLSLSWKKINNGFLSSPTCPTGLQGDTHPGSKFCVAKSMVIWIILTFHVFTKVMFSQNYCFAKM